MFHYPAAQLARFSDPETSLESAAGDRTTHRRLVLEAFAERGASGLDYISAAKRAGLERHEAERRISDLRNLGYLEVLLDRDGHPVRVQLPSGRSGRVHVITHAGRAALSGGAA
jgi:hypothetical protein